MHPDDYIERRDRKKDIIISGGGNISTIVALRPGTTASEPEIIEFCRQHLAHFKCPKAAEFTELPKTSTGKIQKFRLRREGVGRARQAHPLTGRVWARLAT